MRSTISTAATLAPSARLRLIATTGTIDLAADKSRRWAQIPRTLSLDKTGRYLLVANYTSGNIAVFPIEKDGRLGARSAFVQHAGSSVNKERQAGPHAHEIQASNDNQFVLAADLGLDELLVYRFDSKNGSLTPNDPAFVKVSPGSGPRHFAIAPSGKFVYLVNEMSSTVTVFRLHDQLRETAGTTDNFDASRRFQGRKHHGRDRSGCRRASFCTCRIEETTALRCLLSIRTTGSCLSSSACRRAAKTPRHFTLDPTGKWLFAANQDSNSITIFRVDPRQRPADANLTYVAGGYAGLRSLRAGRVI